MKYKRRFVKKRFKKLNHHDAVTLLHKLSDDEFKHFQSLAHDEHRGGKLLPRSRHFIQDNDVPTISKKVLVQHAAHKNKDIDFHYGGGVLETTNGILSTLYNINPITYVANSIGEHGFGIQNTNNDKVNNIEEVFSQLTKFLIKQKVAETEQNIELRSKEQELEMEYQAALRSDIEKAKARSFGDSDPVTGTTGQFTYEYMKNMCKRTKMIDKTQGQSARKESTQAITKNNSKNINERQSVVSVVSESRKTQDRHYELFCSEEDRSQGLCDVVSALPNADLTADTFLKPEGFSSASDDYKTKFTYNETEALAANSFIKNVIGFLPVEPPTPEELTNKSKTQFVTMYNQILASLNTASLSFEKAYLNRLPKNKEGVRMSQLDVLNYLVEDMNSIQNQNLESQAKANAYEMSVQSVMAIKTKIDMEKLLQKERLKLLEATILALQENKPNKVLNLENKK